MGFMDKMKSSMSQAQEAAKNAGGMMPSSGQAAYAQLANKLAQSGVPCTAEIVSVSETGKRDMGSVELAIPVRVEGNGEPYEATVNQYVVAEMTASYVPGSRWQAKADPDDRTRLLLFGTAS